jgi:uncharacterized protein (TIGR03083 family)
MGNDATSGMFDTELAAVSELARELTPDQWQQPSLCTDWSVRDVFRHVAFHTHRAGLRQILGNGDKWTARLTAEAHADTIDGLVAWLASPAPDSARRSMINVCELVIHQQDVRRPLGTPRVYPDATMRACLQKCTTATGNLFVIGVPRRHGRGLRLVANDLDWSAGNGPEVTGAGEALLMAIAGRPAALADLSGPGIATLAERVDRSSSTVATTS